MKTLRYTYLYNAGERLRLGARLPLLELWRLVAIEGESLGIEVIIYVSQKRKPPKIWEVFSFIVC